MKMILGFLGSLVGMLALALVTTALLAFPVMLLWNDLIVKLFELSQISFVQAAELVLLCNLLFKSISPSSKR